MKKVIILGIFLLLNNFAWLCFYAYSLIDQGVTISHQADSYAIVETRLAQALVVANKNLVGQPLSRVNEVLTVDAYGLEPFVKGQCLYAGGLCLHLGEGKVITHVSSE